MAVTTTGGKRIDVSGSGGMEAGTYDTDADSVVDNAELLQGQNSAYHLARANHTGTQAVSTLSDYPATASQAEAEAGTETAARIFTPERVKQAIDALSGAVTLARISGSTYSTIQHLQDIFHSSGWTSGGAITHPGGAFVDVAAGTGLVRATDSSVAELLYFDWSASNGIAVSADTKYWIGVEYNGGSPQVTLRTSASFDNNTEFLLGKVLWDGTKLHIEDSPQEVGDHAAKMIQRLRETMPFKRDDETGGLILGETGTRNITVSAGALWDGLTRSAITALDTSVTGTVSGFYDDGASGWTEVTGLTAWPNTQYDNQSGSLQTMTNNRWGNLWFYIATDGDVAFRYPSAEYSSLSAAEAEAPPATNPDRITHLYKLIGRIVFQKSAATAEDIQSAFATTFPATAATDHGSLAGLADDDHTQYPLLVGRSGGQTLQGGTASGEDLTLESTANATKGTIILSDIAKLPSFTVAQLPSAGTAGRIAYCSNGDTGSPCLAVDNGSNWVRVVFGATVASS